MCDAHDEMLSIGSTEGVIAARPSCPAPEREPGDLRGCECPVLQFEVNQTRFNQTRLNYHLNHLIFERLSQSSRRPILDSHLLFV